MAGGFSQDFLRANDEGLRESGLRTLEHLVSGTLVHGLYGIDIEIVEARIEQRTMVGWKLGFLGPWLPEWQFIKDENGNTEVTPLALEIWEAWGPYNQGAFVNVMATHTLDNVPTIGQRSTYGRAVQLGFNLLDDRNARSYFEDHGVSHS